MEYIFEVLIPLYYRLAIPPQFVTVLSYQQIRDLAYGRGVVSTTWYARRT
jgi:hypothetical protein